MAKTKFQMGDIVKVKNVNWMSAKYRNLTSEIRHTIAGIHNWPSKGIKISRKYFLKNIDRTFSADDLEKTTNREAFLYHLHGPGKY